MKLKILILILSFHLTYTNKNIVIATIPKSGTHLLSKCIKLMTGLTPQGTGSDWIYPPNILPNENSFLITHAICKERNIINFIQNKFKVICMIRDPRDQVISLANYIKHHEFLWSSKKGLLFDEIIVNLIESYSFIHGAAGFTASILSQLNGIVDFYNLYIPWKKFDFIYVIKYEDLVGFKGAEMMTGNIRQLKILPTILKKMFPNKK